MKTILHLSYLMHQGELKRDHIHTQGLMEGNILCEFSETHCHGSYGVEQARVWAVEPG